MAEAGPAPSPPQPARPGFGRAPLDLLLWPLLRPGAFAQALLAGGGRGVGGSARARWGPRDSRGGGGARGCGAPPPPCRPPGRAGAVAGDLEPDLRGAAGRWAFALGSVTSFSPSSRAVILAGPEGGEMCIHSPGFLVRFFPSFRAERQGRQCCSRGNHPPPASSGLHSRGGGSRRGSAFPRRGKLVGLGGRRRCVALSQPAPFHWNTEVFSGCAAPAATAGPSFPLRPSSLGPFL